MTIALAFAASFVLKLKEGLELFREWVYPLPGVFHKECGSA